MNEVCGFAFFALFFFFFVEFPAAVLAFTENKLVNGGNKCECLFVDVLLCALVVRGRLRLCV